MKTLQDVQYEKEECEKKIHFLLMDFINKNPISNISIDVKINTFEKQSGDKIFKVRPIITIGI